MKKTRVKGQGTRVKGQGTRVKGQGTRVKGQGTRVKNPQNFRTSEQTAGFSELQNLKTKRQESRDKGSSLSNSELQNLRTSELQNLRTSEP